MSKPFARKKCYSAPCKFEIDWITERRRTPLVAVDCKPKFNQNRALPRCHFGAGKYGGEHFYTSDGKSYGFNATEYLLDELNGDFVGILKWLESYAP